MAHDVATVIAAYRLLGLEPGASPLAARERYRELIKDIHPDRHVAGSPSQAEATRRTQTINEAYRTIREAARDLETSTGRSSGEAHVAAAKTVNVNERLVAFFDVLFDDVSLRTNATVRIVGEHALAAFIGVLLGICIDRIFLPDSSTLWIAAPLALGLLGAALGWRAVEVVMAPVWWVV